MRISIILWGATAPWVIYAASYAIPVYARAIDETPSKFVIRSTLDGVCKVDSLDYFIRTILIVTPISFALIIACIIWAYFLSSRPDYISKEHARWIRKQGYDAVRRELNK